MNTGEQTTTKPLEKLRRGMHMVLITSLLVACGGGGGGGGSNPPPPPPPRDPTGVFNGGWVQGLHYETAS